MIGGSRNLRALGIYFPMEVGTDISAFPAAGLAGELGLQIGQADVVGPSVAADRNPVRAVIIRAIDQEPANAGFAHFAKGDLLGPGHAP